MTEGRVIWRPLQALARVLTHVFFNQKTFGLEHIPLHGGALIVSNHQSNLDPVLLGVHLPRPMTYLAKSELFEINPLFSALLRSLGGIPIHLGHGDVGAVRQAIQCLHEGHLLNIYPEGSRTPDGEIGRIEKGVALIERRAQVPIIPAVIVGAFEAWPLTRRFPRPFPVRVQFGPPMQLADKKPEEILTTIDQTLRKMFDDLRAQSAPRRGLSLEAR